MATCRQPKMWFVQSFLFCKIFSWGIRYSRWILLTWRQSDFVLKAWTITERSPRFKWLDSKDWAADVKHIRYSLTTTFWLFLQGLVWYSDSMIGHDYDCFTPADAAGKHVNGDRWKADFTLTGRRIAPLPRLTIKFSFVLHWTLIFSIFKHC